MNLLLKIVLAFAFFTSTVNAQPFSFVGLSWGDDYATVNKKLVSGGFSPLMELVIDQREPATQVVRMRQFQDGQLLGQPTSGVVWLENGRLIGVAVYIEARKIYWEKLYDEALSNLQNRYGRQNIGLPQKKAKWGKDDGESIELSFNEQLASISILYKSEKFSLLQRQGKTQEQSKF